MTRRELINQAGRCDDLVDEVDDPKAKELLRLAAGALRSRADSLDGLGQEYRRRFVEAEGQP